MIRVDPMPEELAESHWCRTRLINGPIGRQRMHQVLKPQGTSRFPTLYLLADLARIERENYASAHSMISCLMVSLRRANPLPHGSDANIVQAYIYGMITPACAARVCVNCFREDINKHGFAWFHREHHLKGVDWCLTHEEPLKQSTDKLLFERLPDVVSNADRWFTLNTVRAKEYSPGTFLHRFASISKSFLGARSPIPSENLHRVLSRRAKELGFGNSGKKPRIDKVIKGSIPQEWLQKHFPILASTPSDEKYWPLYNLLQPSAQCVSGEDYFLAITFLYSSFDEFRNDIGTALSNSPPSDNLSMPINEEFWCSPAYKMYLECKGNIAEMASQLNMNVNSLRDQMLKLGMPGMRGKNRSKIWMAFQDFCKGQDLHNSCAKNAVPVAEVEAILRHCAINVFRVCSENELHNKH